VTFISNGLYGPNDRFGLYPFSCLPSSFPLNGLQVQHRMTGWRSTSRRLN